MSRIVRLALGDFRDRIRRPAYAVTLLAAVGLGLLAVPPTDGHWAILALGSYRGEYNSAYVGTATALAGTLWLTLGGFYVVRKGLGRDEETGVGQLLAAAPLRNVELMLAKFLGNLLVLGSMLGVLALTAPALQLVRGEDRALDPVALLTPFLVLTLPLLAATAALAVLFETVPLLRGGLGNVTWFTFAPALLIAGEAPGAPFGGLGLGPVAASLRDTLATRGVDLGGDDFSLGLTKVDSPLEAFRWDGADYGTGFLAQRLLLVLLAVALAALPALWFTRFDPARARAAERHPDGTAPTPTPGPALTAAAAFAPPAGPASAPHARHHRSHSRFGSHYGRLLLGEARILFADASRWWWFAAAGLVLAGLSVPPDTGVGAVLPAAWVWPVLLWSRLGSRSAENDLEVLLGAYPAARARLLAEWAAGVLLTALIGAGVLVRLAAAGDTAGVAAWSAGALFIPSLALALGTLSRTHRLFQALYLPLWYLAVNQVAALDFMGTVRRAGHPAGPSPVLVTAITLTLLSTTLLTTTTRRALRG
ncbi:ABC transporter permease [Kitasatospora purpeofusca]